MNSRLTRGTIAMLMLPAAVVCLFGCSSASPNHVPPPPESRIQAIQNNPHMTQAQKDEAIQLYRSHQSMGSQRGRIVQKATKNSGQ